MDTTSSFPSALIQCRKTWTFKFIGFMYLDDEFSETEQKWKQLRDRFIFSFISFTHPLYTDINIQPQPQWYENGCTCFYSWYFIVVVIVFYHFCCCCFGYMRENFPRNFPHFVNDPSWKMVFCSFSDLFAFYSSFVSTLTNCNTQFSFNLSGQTIFDVVYSK